MARGVNTVVNATSSTQHHLMKTKQVIEAAHRISKPYRVRNGKKFRLKDVDPGDTGEHTSEDKARANVEHFKTLLDRTEKERDEAKEFAAESFRRVQALEKKLNEASAFLNGLKNGNHLTSANR